MLGLFFVFCALAFSFGFSCLMAWLLMLAIEAFGFAIGITLVKVVAGGFILFIVTSILRRSA